MTIERRKRKDGGTTFYAKVFVGVHPTTGKRQFRTKSFRDSLTDAQEWKLAIELAHLRGNLAEPSKESFAVFVRRFVDDVLAHRVRARTLEGYSDYVRRFIEDPPAGFPLIGSIRVDKLKSGDLQRLYSHMTQASYAAGTVRHLHAVLRQALVQADRVSILQKVQLPKKDRWAPQVMTEEELGRFLRAAKGDRYGPVWILLGTTGMRPSEALGLKWSDVDFEMGRIRVARALTRPRTGGWKLTEPKTRNGRRTIPVPESTLAVLRAWKKEQTKTRLAAGKNWEDHDFVTTADSGEPLDWTNLRKSYQRVCAEAGGLGEWEAVPEKPKGQPGPQKSPAFVPTFRPYDLRHSVITHLLRNGVNPKAVSEMAGHASVGFTLDVYAGSLLPSSGDQVAAIMDALAVGE